MITSSLLQALNTLGFVDGFAFNEELGILVWERDEPQPTEEELVAAGWVKAGA